LDIQKAEAQFRESQVQLSLERVRARSMAMHNSNELADVCLVLFEEISKLTKTPDRFNIVMPQDGGDLLEVWLTDQEGHKVSTKFLMSSKKSEVVGEIFKGWKEKKQVLIFDLKGKKLNDWIAYSSEVLGIPFKKDQKLKERFITSALFEYGYIGTTDHTAPSEEVILLIQRFAKVFEQAYRRFLDLERAEKQAREAQIEVALERIRARAMAMHHSGELPEVLTVLFEQFDTLGINPVWAHLSLIDLEENTFTYRMTGQKGKRHMAEQVVSLDARPEWQDSVEAFKRAEPHSFSLLHFPKEVLPQLWELFSETLGSFPEGEGFHPNDFPDGLYNAQGNCKFGYIGFNHNRPPTEEEKEIIIRFAKEFGRLYQRFLDIQRAEAQAREAQIETSLERIRARAMAMHHTDELTDVLCVLFEQFDLLGINPVLTHLTLFDEANETFSIRLTTTADHGVVAEQLIDIHAIEVWKQAYAQWKNCEPNSVNTIDYAPEDLPHLWDLLSEVMGALPAGHKINPTDFPSGLFTTQGHFKFGYLGFNNSRKATEEEKSIVSRFAREFGRTYQRFLDLEKAEAQAKEAQIEAALEKVRSRSMGMQNTREMQLVANEIREQLFALGVPLDAMAMSGVIDNDSDYDVWVGGAISEKPLRITHSSGTQVQREYNQVIRDRPELFMKTYSGKIMKEYFKQLLDTNSFNPEIEAFMKESSAFTTTLTFMKNSGIQIIRYTDEPFSDSNNEIVIRFGKVFEQAYIRFLDLQKAEAQTREARIEAALEKVRSRTMGMQSSAELPEVANLLFLEVQGLGVPSWSSGFNVLLEDKKSADAWMRSEGTIQEPFVLRLWGEASFDEMGSFIRSKEPFMVQELGGKALEEHYNYMKSFPDLQATFEKLEVLGLSLPTYQINHLCKFSNGFLLFITYEQVPEAHDIFKRFTKVFDQTYTRFLDLQKAEAQAREAKIEAALERIRSHSIGMQSAADFGKVTTEMFEQLRNFGEDLYAAGIVFCDKHEGHVEQWHSIPGGGMLTPFIVPIDLDYIHQYRYDQWKEGKELFSIEIPGDFIEQHFKDIFDLPSAQIALQDLKSRNAPMPATPTWEIDYGASFKNGYILISSLKYLETTDILPRFARVFDQTYTRFLDLQKAEAQAREAQIEAALERVRSRTLAMQKSDELAETAAILFQQLIQLGIEPNRLYIGIIKDNSSVAEFWTTEEDGSKISTAYTTDLLNNASFKKMYEALRRKEKSTVVDIQGKDLKEYIEYLSSLNIPFKEGKKQTRRIQYLAYFSKGFIGMASPDEQPKESLEILERFAYAFNLTFTRFNDLKVAEAQAKEAQIEASLERVRSRAMAMRHSDDLINCTRIVFDELEKLNLSIERSGIGIFDPKTRDCQLWTTVMTEEGEKELVTGITSLTVHPMLIATFDSWLTQKPYSYVLEGKELEDYYRLVSKSDFVLSEEVIQKSSSLPKEYYHYSPFGAGGVYFFSDSAPLDEDKQIIRRLAEVFDLTYTRFLDLQKAEAQTKEAQIELSLERIRAQVTAMRQSEELFDIVVTMRREFILLGHQADYFWHMKWIPESYEMSMTSEDGERVGMIISVPKFVHDEIPRLAEWEKSESPTIALDLNGQEAWDYIDKMNTYGKYEQADPHAPTEEDIMAIGGLTFVIARTTHGEIGFSLPGQVPNPPSDSVETLVRFAGVFDLAYRRFEDLLNAEKQNRKAKIELALERVRARAMAMQEPEELIEVAQVMREEMGLLGVEELETSSIYINKSEGEAECWYSIKDIRDGAKTYIADHFDLNYKATWVGRKMLDFHQSSETKTSILMKGENRVEWINYCANQSTKLDGYYGTEIPERTYHLTKFSNGAIGAATPGEISDESWDLLQRAAAAFSLAYSRFKDLSQAREDLKKLKKAKSKAEKALKELKSAQEQLIQQEKLASLGQLTAGIAHEIKNPLNFVNNFSDLSRELIDEVLVEFENIQDSESKEEILAILQDVKSNLTKVYEHGTRADGIVKSMLQHSRGSAGKIEAMDPNQLMREFSNLAFHGMRAGKSPINVDLDFDLDPDAGMVNMIMEDFSRVILNICNNAFDAMRDRFNSSDDSSYLPKLSIRTKREKQKLTMAFQDNGPGIPKEIQDKILQPFFTTKKGTEGTGLGLSITHDIIKAHGGELRVESELGQGSTFSIVLPLV